MGGFEGGDEGGFWDIDMLEKQNIGRSKHTKRAISYIEKKGSVCSIKAYAKAATSPKAENGTLLSCAEHVQEPYDTISFVPSRCAAFTIESPDEIPLEQSGIYRAYQALINYTADTDIEEFFYEHKVVVIRGTAAVVSDSSHAAAFILLAKELCNLILRNDELAKIGNTINSDVSFLSATTLVEMTRVVDPTLRRECLAAEVSHRQAPFINATYEQNSASPFVSSI